MKVITKKIKTSVCTRWKKCTWSIDWINYRYSDLSEDTGIECNKVFYSDGSIQYIDLFDNII